MCEHEMKREVAWRSSKEGGVFAVIRIWDLAQGWEGEMRVYVERAMAWGQLSGSEDSWRYRSMERFLVLEYEVTWGI